MCIHLFHVALIYVCMRDNLTLWRLKLVFVILDYQISSAVVCSGVVGCEACGLKVMLNARRTPNRCINAVRVRIQRRALLRRLVVGNGMCCLRAFMLREIVVSASCVAYAYFIRLHRRAHACFFLDFRQLRYGLTRAACAVEWGTSERQ